jgi:hypothetical protein
MPSLAAAIAVNAARLYTKPLGNAIGGLYSSMIAPLNRHTNTLCSRTDTGNGVAYLLRTYVQSNDQ